jgi:hypothetical protein
VCYIFQVTLYVQLRSEEMGCSFSLINSNSSGWKDAVWDDVQIRLPWNRGMLWRKLKTGWCHSAHSTPLHTARHHTATDICRTLFNTLNAELNPICHLLALLGTHHILHVSRIRVNTVKPSGHYMYRTVVTICTTSLTFNNFMFCPHSVFMCFVWISMYDVPAELTVILISIWWLQKLGKDCR